MIALRECSGKLWGDRLSMYFISQSILLDFLLHAYVTLMKEKKNYTRFTSCNLMGSLGPCIILQGYVKSYKGCTLSKHLPLWWNVEGTIKDTDENCNPSTTCRNICVNSDKFCRSQFDLIHHWKTCNSIGEKHGEKTFYRRILTEEF